MRIVAPPYLMTVILSIFLSIFQQDLNIKTVPNTKMPVELIEQFYNRQFREYDSYLGKRCNKL